MSTIFSKIIQGEIPCHKIAEDEHYLAFLDVRPIKAGHTLVIPKQEIDYYFDLSDDMLAALMVFAKAVAKKIQAAIPCQKIGVMVAGLEVPHTHVHLVPIEAVADLNFSLAKPATDEELARVAKSILNP